MEIETEIMEEIQTAPSQFGKAKAEQRALDALSSIEWKQRLKQVAVISNDTYTNVEHRIRILRASPRSDDLWPLIDSKQLSLPQAVKKLRISEKEAGIYRGKILPEPEPAPKSEPKQRKKKSKEELLLLAHLSSLFTEMKELFEKEYPDLDIERVALFVEDFESDVKRSYKFTRSSLDREEELFSFLQSFKLDGDTLKDVYRSCNIIGIDKPKRNHPVNLDEIRKISRKELARLHPDVNRDNPDIEAKYKELTGAIAILTRYNEELSELNVS